MSITISRMFVAVSLIHFAYEATEKTESDKPIAVLLLLDEYMYLFLCLVSDFLKYFFIDRHLNLFKLLNVAAKKLKTKGTSRASRMVASRNFGLILQLPCVAIICLLEAYVAINLTNRDHEYILFWFWKGYNPLEWNNLAGIAKVLLLFITGVNTYEDNFRNMYFLLYSVIYYVLAYETEQGLNQQQRFSSKKTRAQCVKLYRCKEKYNEVYGVQGFFAELHDILLMSLLLLPEVDILPEAGLTANIFTLLLKFIRYLFAGFFAHKVKSFQYFK